jgi:activator of HSP90 ATPase
LAQPWSPFEWVRIGYTDRANLFQQYFHIVAPVSVDSGRKLKKSVRWNVARTSYLRKTATNISKEKYMSIRKEVSFSVSPERVYELLTDSNKFAAATGRPANIGKTEGADFSIFGDFISGKQMELIPSQLIVQSWRFSAWKPGVFSRVRISLSKAGSGTKLLLEHDAIPDGKSPDFPTWEEHISTNWPVYYFEPFAKYLAG